MICLCMCTELAVATTKTEYIHTQDGTLRQDVHDYKTYIPHTHTLYIQLYTETTSSFKKIVILIKNI